MFFPFISKRSRRLFRRKGGGGGGGGGKGGGKSGSGGGSSSSRSIKTGSTSRTTVAYKDVHAPPTSIPAGQRFAGRMEGGGTRGGIFGTRTFGSGYPDLGPGVVSGRGFPYFFWPIAWIPLFSILAVEYRSLDSTQEYGLPTDPTRPGGALAYATFPLSSSPPLPSPVVFRILADNFTVASLISDLTANCSKYLSNSSAPPNTLSTTPNPYTNLTGPAIPRPEQAVQYYRASSLVLTLDSYNNTAIYSDENISDTPLPALGQNGGNLLECLNVTIGMATPLVSSGRLTAPTDVPLLTFFVLWLVWCLIRVF